jgi:hypothetical protein
MQFFTAKIRVHVNALFGFQSSDEREMQRGACVGDTVKRIYLVQVKMGSSRSRILIGSRSLAASYGVECSIVADMITVTRNADIPLVGHTCMEFW